MLFFPPYILLILFDLLLIKLKYLLFNRRFKPKSEIQILMKFPFLKFSFIMIVVTFYFLFFFKEQKKYLAGAK